MHVLYILGQSTGGLPHYTAELANAVAKRADVTVMKPSKTTADELFSSEVDVRNSFEPINLSLPKIYSLDINPFAVIRGMLSYDNLKEIRNIDADITHETSDLFPQVKLFTKFHGIDKLRPFIVTRHEVLRDRLPLSQPPVLAEKLINNAIPDLEIARTIVHTEKQRDVLVERGEDSETVTVIPHGAYSIFGNIEDISSNPEQNTLLFFGNVIPEKGLDTLVKAIPMIRQHYPDVTLLIAGEGQISKTAKSIIEEYRENFEVHNYFVPNDRVKDLFARSELVVLPYRKQGGTKGHSGTLVTAFSFGKPVVTSTAGEFPRQVEQSGAGTVVPPDDPKSLAEAITCILGDEEAKERMATKSREMGERLSWESVAEQYLELYRSVLDSSQSVQTDNQR